MQIISLVLLVNVSTISTQLQMGFHKKHKQNKLLMCISINKVD